MDPLQRTSNLIKVPCLDVNTCWLYETVIITMTVKDTPALLGTVFHSEVSLFFSMFSCTREVRARIIESGAASPHTAVVAPVRKPTKCSHRN